MQFIFDLIFRRVSCCKFFRSFQLIKFVLYLAINSGASIKTTFFIERIINKLYKRMIETKVNSVLFCLIVNFTFAYFILSSVKFWFKSLYFRFKISIVNQDGTAYKLFSNPLVFRQIFHVGTTFVLNFVSRAALTWIGFRFINYAINHSLKQQK